MNRVDGRERYALRCGVGAEDIIAEVMTNVSGQGAAVMWDVGNACKYLLRLGKKDDINIEMAKAENYLHHARTGEWIGGGR